MHSGRRAMSAPSFPVTSDPQRWPTAGNLVTTMVVGSGAEDQFQLAHKGRLGTHQRIRLVAALGDTAGAITACALVAGWALPWGLPAPSPWQRLGFAALCSAVIVGFLVLRRTYGSARYRVAPSVADDLAGILAGIGTAGLCLLALHALPGIGSCLSPAAVGILLALALVTVPVARASALRVASHDPANVSRVVVVGGGSVADYLVERLSRSRLVHVVGVIDDVDLPGRPRLGRLEDLPTICSDKHVDRILVAFSGRHPAGGAEILQHLRDTVDIDIVVRYYELASWESRLSDVTGLSLLTIGQRSGPVAAATKRLLDITVAVLGLIAFSPVMVTVAVAVRLGSGSPVLFRQTRIGRDRRPFRILKFRTMVPAHTAPSTRTGSAGSAGSTQSAGSAGSTQSAGSAGQTGSDGASIVSLPVTHLASATDRLSQTPLDLAPDPTRITPLGQVLRRSGLDELPQLVNVLRGEMSLVGPRPFVPEECGRLHGTVERRFDVRPGMTGMWQVCGQHEVSFDELCRLDVQYATSWSLRGDLRILARTPSRLVRGSALGR